MNTNTDKIRRSAKACAFNIRTALQNAVAAGLNDKLLDRLRALSLEIAAEADAINGE